MSKSLITDLLSILLIGLSFVVPVDYHNTLLFTGLFALSGAITNQLAIHMLFERVPFLYGSGVIEKNFETFKESIRVMIMKQFFTKEQLGDFFSKEEQKIDKPHYLGKANYYSFSAARSRMDCPSAKTSSITAFPSSIRTFTQQLVERVELRTIRSARGALASSI